MAKQFAVDDGDQFGGASSEHDSPKSGDMPWSQSFSEDKQSQNASFGDQSDSIRGTELDSSCFESRSPSGSSASSLPPPTDDLDRTLRHIGMQEFGKSLDIAARAMFPNDTACRYNKVYVLLITWKTQDPKLPVAVELCRLRSVFKDIYHYEVEEFEIPDDDSHAETSEKINAFVKLNKNSRDNLKIVYYAGHGRLSPTKELIWYPEPERKNHKSPRVKWSGIQTSLEMAKSDVLILLDCCSSGVVHASDGDGITELICACGYDAAANGVGPFSFTHELSIELRLLSNKPTFTVGELYSAVYTRMQSHMKQGVANERYPSPMHFVFAPEDSFYRSISLSVRKPDAIHSKTRLDARKRRSCSREIEVHNAPIEPPHRNKRRRLEHEVPRTWSPVRNGSVPDDGEELETGSNYVPESRSSIRRTVDGDVEMQMNTSDCGLKDSLHPHDGPRALFLVRFSEDIGPENLCMELFKDWMGSCPSAVDEIRIEASYKCYSTLVFITMPLAMQDYMPKDPAIMALGAVKSSISIAVGNVSRAPLVQTISMNKSPAKNHDRLDGVRDTSNDGRWSAPQRETMSGQLLQSAAGNSSVSNLNRQWAVSGRATEIGMSHGVNTTQVTNDGYHASIQDDLGDCDTSLGSANPFTPFYDATTTKHWAKSPATLPDQAMDPKITWTHTEDFKIPANISLYHPVAISDSPSISSRMLQSDMDGYETTPGQAAVSKPSTELFTTNLSDQHNADETEFFSRMEWRRVEMSQVSDTGSSPPTSESGWSLVASSNAQSMITRESSVSRDTDSVHWVAVDSKEGKALQKAVQFGPFLDPQLREKISHTRKLKACIRCRMQKIRCLIGSNDPTGTCQTCKDVSTQRVHSLPCLRYKLTDCIIYRTGKAQGLDFTSRWPEMKLKDITEWSSDHIRTIKVQSDLCATPLELEVRRFVPMPQDSLRQSWMDGTKIKFKEITPYAIVNMSETVDAIGDYINRHIFECVAYWLKDKDEWVQETYAFARKYMLVAPPDEQGLLSDTFRLWYAVRRTATTDFIVGNDTLDMEPERKDRSYPLFGKVPLPPVMIQQLEMILTLGFLKPLRKKFLEDFQRLTMSNNPRSWMAIYLITFIACHSCAAVTAEHYKDARKHGLKRKYAMPVFISDLHHSANVYLSYYHYCTSTHNPFAAIKNWDKRETTRFADMSTTEFHFLRRTEKMLEEREDRIKDVNQFDLYEDDLYFVAQMHEKNWTPRDTKIDFTEGSIGDVPLKR